jgi:hypothetical protein
MKHCVVTSKILKDAGACSGWRRRFVEDFNGRLAITTQNLHKAANWGFPIDWLANLLPKDYCRQLEDNFIFLLNRRTSLAQDMHDLSPFINKLFERAFPDGEGFPLKQTK